MISKYNLLFSYRLSIFPVSLKSNLKLLARNMSSVSNPIANETDEAELMKKLGLDSETYLLVDIGANLTNKKYARDLDGVIQRAKDSGVQKIMVTGTCVQSSQDSLRLTRLYPTTLYSTAGVHPHDAKTWTDETETFIRDLAANNSEVVAIGECGLDFNRNFSPPETQLEVFEKQVQIACDLKKPLFVHEREAHEDMVKILTKYSSRLPPTVIHCFTGTIDEAKKYIELGYYIGLTGFLWKDKSDNGVRKTLEEKVIPLDRLMVETDAPFMYPNTRANKLPEKVKKTLTDRSLSFLERYCTFQRNEPCSLPVTVEMVSAFLEAKPEDVALKTSFNALKVFGLT
ncbi:uncharacterized protein LOC107359505 [Tetranychus urticae]|nr:uncharacterized protein LOC107359505 [Tetranychus urticae]